MHSSNLLFDALKLHANNKAELNIFCKKAEITPRVLKEYNDKRVLPGGNDLDKICQASGLTRIELQLKMGIINRALEDAISKNAEQIYGLIKTGLNEKRPKKNDIYPEYETKLGKLYHTDCLDLLEIIENDSIDLVFADPPFNLKKLYPSKINDDLKSDQYLQWCEEWLDECIRILKPGGSLFIWNLPKWNSTLARYLNYRLTFRHWIAVDITYSLPISSRLYPSHYSLLYYCKGIKPLTFKPDRLPMEICPNCMKDLVDYGGYKDKMNPKGVNIADVWYDIPPVRHSKYKGRKDGNELSIKLLDRIIEMSTNENDLIFDPFGGSGTTYIVSELKKRRWIGVEIGPIGDIIKRFKKIDDEKKYLDKIRSNLNHLFSKENAEKRIAAGLWTSETVRNKKKREKEQDNSQQVLKFI